MSPAASPDVPRSRLRARRAPTLVAGSLASFALAACSLDWSVRAGPGNASNVEAGSDALDARAGDDAADASTPDAPETEGGSCPALSADLDARKTKARECQIGQSGQCTMTVDDECGCPIIVRLPGSAETTDYTDGVAAFLAACGKPPAASCACPQLGLPASWGCLAKDATFACRPP